MVPGDGGVVFDCVCCVYCVAGSCVVVVVTTTTVMIVGMVSPGTEILNVNGPGLPSGGWSTCGLSQLFADFQTGHIGGIEWYDNNPASPTYGQVIDSITDTSQAHYFTPRFGQAPLIDVQPATAAQLQNPIINDLFRVLQLINANQTTTPSSGSSTLPDIDVPYCTSPSEEVTVAK
jgi:hypothetical protein